MLTAAYLLLITFPGKVVLCAHLITLSGLAKNNIWTKMVKITF